MASGRAHAALATLALVAVPVALAIWTTTPVVPVVIGLAAGLFVTPDMDIDGGTHEERRRFIGPILRVIFWPYSRIIKHRSFWSHAPVIGTLVRVVYLGVPFWLALAWLGVSEPGVELVHLTWAFAGWALQDALHWVLDW